jgi:hypothetical protein
MRLAVAEAQRDQMQHRVALLEAQVEEEVLSSVQEVQVRRHWLTCCCSRRIL